MSDDFKTKLKNFIQQRALELGFAKVGITSAQPFDESIPARLNSWLSAGYQAEMQWMVTHLNLRLNPASLMENTQSIVCVAMNYHNEIETGDLKIAQYARGSDYHKVVKKKLKQLLKDIQAYAPGIKGRPLTDSAPILEKPLAVQAGLGWLSKNGNVILPEHGSFLFLGEILLDVDLEPDAPFETDHCGQCTRCIDACPTDAIVQDGVVDANRCISYWTIEYKGERFPDNIRENLNGWIFGCDICQDVCPWNHKFATPTTEPDFQPRPWNITPNATEILNLTLDDFNTRYMSSPVKRAKLPGLQRNVREATGI